MIRLRLLGALDLRDADGDAIDAVLAQPKRTALLAYLAAAAPRGVRRRDTLLGLFWPDFDDARARAALNRATYTLRRSLGARVVLSRGKEELELARDRVWCDVAAFEDALDAGDLEAALALYRGELLEGFFLSGTPEFERWLDLERARLRERARGTAWSLSERAERDGDIEAAIRWARRALATSPEDERTLRKLIGLLDRAGDPAGALREYEDFAGRMALAYEAEPSNETRALAAAMRSRNTAARGSAAAHEPEARPAAPRADRPAVPSATHPDPRRRRAVRWKRHIVMASLSALLTLAAAWLVIRPSFSRSDPAAPVAVAVFPFSFRGNAGFAYLGPGMADLLSTSLDGAGALRAVDPRALLSVVAQRGSEPPSPAGAAEIAGRLGAGLLVLGSVVEVDDRFQISASLYRREPPVHPLARAAVTGDVEHVSALIDEVTRRLLAHLPAAPDEDLVRLAARTTASLPALKAYLVGEEASRTGRWDDAVRAYRRAVAADSTFALAFYGLSVAANWTSDFDASRRAIVQAVRYGDELSRAARLRAEAWRAYQAGAGDVAERLYRAVLAEDPTDVEARFYLGEVLFHWGPTLGRPVAASRDAFERVLSIQPDRAGALIHLIRIAAIEGRRGELDSLAARLLAIEPAGGRALEVRALRAFTLGDSTARERIATELAYADIHSLRGVVRSVAAYAYDPAGAAALARLRTAPERAPVDRSGGHLLRAELAAAQGRWRAAETELDRLATFAPGLALEYRAMLAALPFRRLPVPELQRLRAAITNAPDMAPGADAADGTWIDPARGLYLLGLLSARIADTAAAADHTTELDRFRGAGAEDSARAAGYARTLRAVLARMRAEPREALAILGAPRLGPHSTLPDLLSYPAAHAAFLRADLLRELGRGGKALQWYAATPDPAAYNLMYLAPSHLRRAEIYAETGAAAKAAEHYARFIELWEDADLESQSRVEAARRGLTRISGR